MAKSNAMLARIEANIEAQYNRLFHAKMDVLTQMGQDAAMIAANEVLGLGPGRAETFRKAYAKAMTDMARMAVEDHQDDEDFWYAKAKIDQRIKSIVGEENFVPWEVRYGEQ